MRNPCLYPARINFNFLDKCNMNCLFCYSPFDGLKSDLDTWKAIIDKSYDWSVESITFGGGDPFIHPNFSELLEYTFKKFNKKLFLQVDTNGLSLSPKYYPIILETVSLIGLPLEGSSADKNQIIRKHKSHFQNVLRLLKIFQELDIHVKINTMVCQENINDLENIGKLISRFSVNIWSLYEFWAIGEYGLANKNIYEIPHDSFLEKAYLIKVKFSNIDIEIGTVSERKNSYFFVSQTGRAYTVKNDNPNAYIELGSIFDSDVLINWQNHSNYLKNRNRFSSRCSV